MGQCIHKVNTNRSLLRDFPPTRGTPHATHRGTPVRTIRIKNIIKENKSSIAEGYPLSERIPPTKANTPVQVAPLIITPSVVAPSQSNSSSCNISPQLSPVTPPILSEKNTFIGLWIVKKKITPAKELVSSFENDLSNGTSDIIVDNYQVKFPFYMKNIKNKDITMEDYINMKDCWSNIVNNNLYMYYLLKSEGKIDSNDSLSWVYDTFYKKSYLYDEDLKNIFHNNLKLQSKAFINIIKYSIDVARKIAENKKVDYYVIFKVHKNLEISIIHYFEIVYILIETLRECLKILFDKKIEESWKKVMSIILKNIVSIHNRNTIKDSIKNTFTVPDFMSSKNN